MVPPADRTLAARATGAALVLCFLFAAVSGGRFLHWLGALVGTVATATLVQCCLGWFQSQALRRAGILATSLTWFLPNLHAEATPAAMGGSLFFIGFSLLILAVQQKSLPSLKMAIATGLFWGASLAVFRESVLLVFPGLLWFSRYGKPKRPYFLALLGPVALGLLAATLWGSASLPRFGLWASLLPSVVLAAGFPLSVLVIVGVLLAWWLKPRFSLTWVTLPYFLFQLGTGSKDVSALAPLAIAAPALTVMSAQVFKPKWEAKLSAKGWRRIAMAIALLNAFALIVSLTRYF